MKNLVFLVVISLAAATAAWADGFVCQARNDSLNVKVFENVNPADGSVGSAVMVLADPHARDGKKTIARFTTNEGTLKGSGTTFVANIDLRYKDQQNKESLVAGKAQLQELDTIELNANTDQSPGFLTGEQTNGVANLNTRAGDQISVDMVCTHYSKN